MDPATKPVVLLVDDEQDNLDTFVRVFRRDLTVVTAPSGIVGIEKLRERPFDVIISDHSMPRMTGAQFLRQAALIQPEVGRVICTGFPELTEVIEAQKSGLVVTVVFKPWDRDEMLKLVNRLKALSDTRRQLSTLRKPEGS